MIGLPQRASLPFAFAGLALAAVVAGCHDNSSNTAPPTATAITANASTNGQTGTVGQALVNPVAVHVTDQNGNSMAGATVTWTVASGSGSVSSATSSTDASGNATVTWTLGNTAGANSLTAAIAGGASTTITATGQAAAAAAVTIVSGNGQSVTSGSATQPLVVMVADQFGNPVAGVTVAWVVTGGGTLSAASTTTDATGKTQITLTTDAAPASYTVTATALTLTAATFTVTGT
jgi:hypothetical protein